MRVVVSTFFFVCYSAFDGNGHYDFTVSEKLVWTELHDQIVYLRLSYRMIDVRTLKKRKHVIWRLTCANQSAYCIKCLITGWKCTI